MYIGTIEVVPFLGRPNYVELLNLEDSYTKVDKLGGS